MDSILNALTDEENQPHQYVGDLEGLKRQLAGAGKLEFSVRQTENGYMIERHEPLPNNWIFRSAEELVSFIANELL